MQELRRYLTAFRPDEHPWGMFPTSMVDKIMKAWPVKTEDILLCPETKHTTYTAHSVKSGAIQHLLSICVKTKGTVVSLDQIQTLAKQLPPTTVGYIRDKALIARAMNTHEVTKLL